MPDQNPIKNSEVFVLGRSPPPIIPPPSPPEPCCQTPPSSSPSTDNLTLLGPSIPCLIAHNPTLTNSPVASPPRTPTPVTDLPLRLQKVTHVLSTTADALTSLSNLYATAITAQASFLHALTTIHTSLTHYHGKLIISGLGKSGHIAQKLVSTLTSLSIPSNYLHPVEALHGEIGKISPHDVLVLITFSGCTPEMLALLPHLRQEQEIIVISQHMDREDCEVLRRRPRGILLPAPVKEKEEVSFGIKAPTTSTSVALAVCDTLALSVADEFHATAREVERVFDENHPGGAIGASRAKAAGSELDSRRTVREVMVPTGDIPNIGCEAEVTGADVLMAAMRSSSGWVCIGERAFISPRTMKETIRKEDLSKRIREIHGLVCGDDHQTVFPEIHVDENISQLEMKRHQPSEQGDFAIVTTERRSEAYDFRRVVIGVIEVDRLGDF